MYHIARRCNHLCFRENYLNPGRFQLTTKILQLVGKSRPNNSFNFEPCCDFFFFIQNKGAPPLDLPL